MTIHLPKELENSLMAAVYSGRYQSLDDAVADAASLLVRRLKEEQAQAAKNENTPDPLLGLMRDDAELMDAIVADAYRRRREEKWRDVDL